MKRAHRAWFGLGVVAVATWAFSQPSWAEDPLAPPVETVIDAGEEHPPDDSPRNFVIVPIPLSDPTLGTGLVLGAAYFYRQTPEQREVQPPSVTGTAGMYTSNESSAFGVGHQSYWSQDRWRFSGVAGRVNLKMGLLDPDPVTGGVDIGWLISGDYIQAKLMRKVAGDWYLGLRARYFDSRQTFETTIDAGVFDVSIDLQSVGLGVDLEFDTRDVPANPYAGKHFEFGVLANADALGGSNDYQAYNGNYRSYHEVAEKWVLAWNVTACHKSGEVPLWDTCRVGLRGFPGTDYLGKTSAAAQVEGRWRAFARFGFVAFLGGGLSDDSHTDLRNDDLIPSVGVGVRWMVMKAQRINMRLDYARSHDQEAWYLAVTEAF